MEDIKDTRKIKVDSIKLTSELLKKLCEIINEQSLEFKKINDKEDKKAKEDENYWPNRVFYHTKFSFSKNNSEPEYGDSNQFLEDFDVTKFKDIKMNFYSIDREISIWFDNKYFQDIKIEGNLKWVLETTQRIEDILADYETKNKFFYSRSSWLIYFGIPIVIVIGIIFAIAPFLPKIEGTSEQASLFNSITRNLLPLLFFLTVLPASTGLEELFHRLYPRIEIENSQPTKIRKWIVGSITTLAITVLGSGIFYFFQLLTSST